MHLLLCRAHIPVYIVGISGSDQGGEKGPAAGGGRAVEVLPQAAHFHKAARTLKRVPILQFDLSNCS